MKNRNYWATAVLALVASVLTPTVMLAQTSPAAASAGSPATPVSGNYPGTGSSPQKGVVPAAAAPSGATPASGMSGATRTPVDGVTPGTGTSPNPTH